MTEILTESFCERCGTRYTFESARPKTRLSGVKVLGRGFKNFVMSDDTSMDEAMAAARSETDREQTSHQLDAFHKTFNFCMSCRQYTCPNCWNEVEARCLSCAPHLGHDVLPAPFPDLPSGPLVSDPAAFGDPYAPSNGVAPFNGAKGPNGTNGANGAAKGSELIGFSEVQAKRDEEIDAAARLAALTGAPTAPVAEPEPPAAEPAVAPDVPSEAPAATAATSAAPVAEPPATKPLVPDVPLAPAAALPADAPSPYDDIDPSTPTWLKALVVGSAADEARTVEPPAMVSPPAVERPGGERSAAAAPAAEPEVVAAEPEVVAPEPEPVAEPEPQSVIETKPEPVAEPEPPLVIETKPEPVVQVAPEPEPIALEPEPVVQPMPAAANAPDPEPEVITVELEPEPAIDQAAAALGAPAILDEPEPVVEVATQPEPVVVHEPVVQAAPAPIDPVVPAAPPVTDPVPALTQPPVQPAAPAPDLAAAATATPADVVAQPVWQIVAPDDATPVNGSAPATRPEPQWPAQPQWPERAAAAGLPFLNRPATPTGGLDALWAESTREVVASPSRNGKPANVVQPCVSCGLSLSANARFCRRCGTAQGS